jgi:arylsulfatase
MTTEGDFRKRPVVRWPGKFPAGTVANGNTSGMDRLPTFVASTGNPNIVAARHWAKLEM